MLGGMMGVSVGVSVEPRGSRCRLGGSHSVGDHLLLQLRLSGTSLVLNSYIIVHKFHDAFTRSFKISKIESKYVSHIDKFSYRLCSWTTRSTS